MINTQSNPARRIGAVALVAAVVCAGLLVPMGAAAAEAPATGILDASPTFRTTITANSIFAAVTGLDPALYSDVAVSFPDGKPGWLTPVVQYRFIIGTTTNWSSHPPAEAEILETRDAPGEWETQPSLQPQTWLDLTVRPAVSVQLTATRIADGVLLDTLALTGSATANVEFDSINRLQATVVNGVSVGPAGPVPVAAGGISWPWTAPVRHNLRGDTARMPDAWAETAGANAGGLTRSSCNTDPHVLVSPMAVESGITSPALDFAPYPDLADGKWFSGFVTPHGTPTIPTRSITARIDASVVPDADGAVAFDLNDSCATGFGSPVVDTTLHFADPRTGSLTHGGQVIPLPVEYVNVADARDSQTVTSASVVPDGSTIRVTGLTEAPDGFETYASAMGRALLADGTQVNFALALRVTPVWSDLKVEDKRYEVRAGSSLSITEAELLAGGMPEMAQQFLAIAGYEQKVDEPQVSVATDADGLRTFTLDATHLLPGYTEAVGFSATPVTEFPATEPQLASGTATFVVVGDPIPAPPFRAETGGVGANPVAVAGGIVLLIAAAVGALLLRRRVGRGWAVR